MTFNQFRQSEPLTLRLREILQDEVMQQAILTLKDYNAPKEVEADDADPIASTRRHSRGVGWNNALAGLILLSQPIVPVKPDSEEPFYKPETPEDPEQPIIE